MIEEIFSKDGGGVLKFYIFLRGRKDPKTHTVMVGIFLYSSYPIHG